MEFVGQFIKNSPFTLISLQKSLQIPGDGWCDDFNNKPECYFDAGDCCFNVDPQFCTKCECYTDGTFYFHTVTQLKTIIFKSV